MNETQQEKMDAIYISYVAVLPQIHFSKSWTMISNSSVLQPCLQVYAEVYPLAKNAFHG